MVAMRPIISLAPSNLRKEAISGVFRGEAVSFWGATRREGGAEKGGRIPGAPRARPMSRPYAALKGRTSPKFPPKTNIAREPGIPPHD